MIEMMKSELTRFRRVGLFGALAHLLVLRGVMAVGDVFHPSTAELGIGLLVYAGVGLLFGLYQWGTYKKPGRWLYLVHRPLAPSRIFAALAGAVALWTAAIVALPLGLITVYGDLFQPQWVDARAYATALFALGVTWTFYLVGTVAVLHPSRWAALVGSLAILFLTREAVGGWIFVPLVLVLAWLAFLAVACCKPDLSKPLESRAALVASALPLQYALFGALIMAGLLAYSTGVAFREHGWRSYAAHAWNDYFPPRTVEYLGYRDTLGALAHGLDGLDDPRAAELSRQMEPAERFEIVRALRKPPTFGQPTFLDRGAPLVDEEHEVVWTFCHDRRLFQGRSVRSGDVVGRLGRRGLLAEGARVETGDRFQEVPTVVAGSYLALSQTLYAFDARRRRIVERFELDTPGERLASAPTDLGSAVGLLSTRGLYLFDARAWQRELGAVAPTAFVELPGEIRNLSRIDVAELIDGHLVSFAFGKGSARGFYPAEQVMVEVGVEGRSEVLGRVALAQGPPLWTRHQGFVISPLLQTLHDLAWAWIGPYRDASLAPRRYLASPPPSAILLAALGVALGSAALVFFAGRRRGFVGRRLWGWTAATFAGGLPGLVTFFLLAPSRAPALPEPHGSPSAVNMSSWASVGAP